MSDHQSKKHPSELDRALGDFDPAKREVLRKLVVGAAYAVPIVASFSVDGLLVSKVRAQDSPNQS